MCKLNGEWRETSEIGEIQPVGNHCSRRMAEM